jgi:hypothetical protein
MAELVQARRPAHLVVATGTCLANFPPASEWTADGRSDRYWLEVLSDPKRKISGPRNPPVMTKTAHTRCDRLSKISHFSNLATAARPDLWCAPTGASAESRAAARAVPWIARHLTGRKSRTLIGESAV